MDQFAAIGGAPARPTRPESQGYHGASGPDLASYLQGPQGSLGDPANPAGPQTTAPQAPPRPRGPRPPGAPQGPGAGRPRPYTGSGTPPSPVASNGMIPPQGTNPPIQWNTPPPQTAGPMAGLAGDAQTPQPGVNPGIDWMKTPDGQGWIPSNMAQGTRVQGPPLATDPSLAGQSPNPWGAWPARPQNTAYNAPTSLGPQWNPTAAPQMQGVGYTPQGYSPQQLQTPTPQGMGVANLGQDPFTAYQGGQISQFQTPQLQAQAQQQALLASVLNSPDAVSQQQVAAMQGQGQDQIAQMLKMRQQENAQQAASRGFAPGMSGAQHGADRNALEAAQSQLITNNRDMGIQAAQANADARLRTLGVADSLLNSEAGRASSLYSTGLQGEMAQQGVNQNAAASQQQAQAMALQRAISQAGLGQNADRFGLDLAQFGMNRDQTNNANNFQASQANNANNQAAAGIGLQRDALAQQGWGMQNQQGLSAAQLGLQQALGLEGLRGQAAQSNASNYGTDLSAYLQQQGLNQQGQISNRGLDIQQQLGLGGLDMDARRLGESGRQFDQGNNLNWASLMNQMFLGRGQLGLGQAQLQQQSQNQLFNLLFGGG